MEKILRIGTIEDLKAFIEDCEFPERTFVLLEQLPKKVVEKSERQGLLHFGWFDEKIDFASYTSGRIFHPNFELRWEKDDDEMQVVYLGDELIPGVSMLAEIWDKKLKEDLKESEVKKKRYYLFGTRLNPTQRERIGEPAAEGDFAEVRIPRLLRYPASIGGQRVQLVVREYVHKDTSRLICYRFENLVPE